MMRLLDRYPQAATLLLLMGVWELAARTVQPTWLPRFSAVARSGWKLAVDGRFLELASTGRTLLVGMAVVIVVAGLLAFAIASSRLVEQALEPYVNAALATPTVALIPVFVLLWGFGDATRVATVISFSLFPVVVTWAEGIKQAPAHLIEMARAFTAGPRKRIVSVVLPAAAPLIITGLRIGVVQGIKGVVSAEILIGVIGIGRLLEESRFILPQLYAIVTVLLGISVVVYLALIGVEERLARRTTVG